MKRNRVTKVCDVCNKEFEVKVSHAPRRQWCSQPCRSVGMRRRRQSEIEQQFGEPIDELINRLYHAERRPVREVAKILNVSARNLFEWFYDFDIPRRDLSLAVAMQWVDNDERRQIQADAMRAVLPKDFAERRRNSVNANLILQQKNGPTSIERIMMAALNDAGIAYEFQFAVGEKFLCDFAFPDHMLIVECDGEYWHSTPRQKRQDASKDAYLQACGYIVMRFSGTQIRENIHACIDSIKTKIQAS